MTHLLCVCSSQIPDPVQDYANVAVQRSSRAWRLHIRTKNAKPRRLALHAGHTPSQLAEARGTLLPTLRGHALMMEGDGVQQAEGTVFLRDLFT
jgi:hypothetical protein